jgi:hypothetical protein
MYLLTCLLHNQFKALQFDSIKLSNCIFSVLLCLKLNECVPAFHYDIVWGKLLKQILEVATLNATGNTTYIN